MVIAGKCCLGIEVDRPPIPTLRDDAGQAGSDARTAVAVWEQDAEFGRDAWAGLVLQTSRADHVLEKCACCRQA